jgi:RNA polymerase sigma factor (sigma-70 family)
MQTDAPYLKSLQAQDPKVVKDWYLSTFPALMLQASRFFTEEAAQMTAVHNAQLKALKNLSQFKPGTSMEAWLAVILRNELIDLYRRQNKWRWLSFDAKHEIAIEPDFDRQMDVEIELQNVEAVLDKLSPTTRFVFSFYCYEQQKPKEIASALKMNVQTVRWHLKTAKHILKNQLSHD